MALRRYFRILLIVLPACSISLSLCTLYAIIAKRFDRQTFIVSYSKRNIFNGPIVTVVRETISFEKQACTKKRSHFTVERRANGSNICFNIHSILLNAVERMLNDVYRWDRQMVSTFHSTKLSEWPGNYFQAPALCTHARATF